MQRSTAVLWSFRGLMCATFFAIGLCSAGGCAMLREKGPELLRVVCPRCAAAFDLLKGTDHTHETPSADGASHD